MKWKIAVVITACILAFGPTASAHRIDEYLQATLLSLETNRVEGSMRLIPGMSVSSSVIAAIDANGDGFFSEGEQAAYAHRVLENLSITIDGKSLQPKLVSWSFPQPAQVQEGLGEIHIEYIADLPQGGPDRSLILTNRPLSGTSVYLVNVAVPHDRNIRIVTQKRNEQQSFYELDYQQINAAHAVSRRPWSGLTVWLSGLQFSTLFHLGIRHIAEGTDHLLFLLALLLPAPLLVSGSRWGQPAGVRQSLLRILGIVTAFTIGHSITLTWAAFKVAHVPGRPVEVLIAVSIFVSAVHALRPIFPGKEVWIAGFFGLIHGLAFAATLDRLALGRWERVAGILAFNLGIETMQMLVVALILPSLMLMSRTRAYPIFRIGGAVFAGAASLGWIMERLFSFNNPVDAVMNTLARHSLEIAGLLFLVSLACKRPLASHSPITPE
jgi:HupE / UreJ protein